MYRRMKVKHRVKLKHLIACTVAVIILQLSGVLQQILEKDFYTNFHYPYDGDFSYAAYQLRKGNEPDIEPINHYDYPFVSDLREKCRSDEQIRIVYLIKSSPEHFYRRSVIRATWGNEKRFSDVEIRRVFMLGRRDAALQERLDEERARFGDILQSNFTDAYYNNTIKTMMGFKWAVKHCDSAKFYMFVDDDYYVSTKNVLRFVRNPSNYPEYLRGALRKKSDADADRAKRSKRQLVDMELPPDVKLYAGYVYNSKPLRHYFTKFYVGLAEYPYNYWPPYVTAGACLLSREALMDMYYASFYTKHFRFDDIYVSLLALRTNIRPFHSDEFYVDKKEYTKAGYTFTVASHGFGDPVELMTAWTEQKAAGNA